VLHVNLHLPTSAVHGGDSVKGRVYVYATQAKAQNTRFHLKANGGATVSPQEDLKTVDDKSKFRDVTVTVPKNMSKGTIVVTAIASADGAKDASDQSRFTVTKKPAPKPTTTSSGGTGSSGGSSGSTNTTTSAGSTGSAGSGALPPVTAPGYVPPSPAAAAMQSPQVSLPEIPAATPSTAPTMAAAAPTTTLRSGGSPQSQELTFERLASTQIAWLAALLVAFSVLMTQLRLGRPAGARVRPKGDHRRPRGGLFQR
jgi:hypothetical protein